MKMVTPILSILLFISFSFQEDVYKEKREKMVKDQIERRGINDKFVLKAMRNVKRHLFVPEERIADAYDDGPLPIGYGQTISQPYIVAYMTEVIQPKAEFKVLEIGTGSGYQAAVLAEIVKEVYTIEIVTELANAATQRLKKLGYSKVNVKEADYYGWKENDPYDAIIVTAAAEFVPPPLIEQLKENGKIVIPIGSPFMTQTLMLIEKNGKKIKTKNLLPVRFVPFTRKK